MWCKQWDGDGRSRQERPSPSRFLPSQAILAGVSQNNSTRQERPMPCLIFAEATVQHDSMLRPVRYWVFHCPSLSQVPPSFRKAASPSTPIVTGLSGRGLCSAPPNESRQPSETVCSHQRPPTVISTTVRALFPPSTVQCSTTPARRSHPSYGVDVYQ